MSPILSLEQFFPYRCNRLAERISRAMAKHYTSRSGLNIAQWRILATLGEHGSMLARDVALQTNMDKVRVSRAVKLMLADDLLSSQQVDNDLRAFSLSLSEKGQQLYAELVPQVLSWERDLLGSLSEDEQAQLMSTFAQLEAKLETLEKAL